MATTEQRWKQLLKQAFLRIESVSNELCSGKISKTVATSIVAALVLLLFILFAGKLRKKKQKKDRCRGRLQVNCWFCNADSVISYNARNEWDCRYCGQYNGFTEDGDYNKEVPGMHAAIDDFGTRDFGMKQTGMDKLSESFDNGPRLCDPCNRMQILKVKQIAAFVPTVEGYFDFEVENYKRQLERTYQLCNRCERSLQMHLSDQDMQIRETYRHHKDIRRNVPESDPEKDEIEPKHKRKVHHKQPKSWNLLSLLWPSSILSVVSFLMAWCLLVLTAKGILQSSIYHFLLTGFIARALLWILNPFSKRKLLLLLLWTSMFVVTKIQRIFKYENVWLVSFIAIFETWKYFWSLVWFFATILRSCLTRIDRRIRNVKPAPSTENEEIPSKVPVKKKRKLVIQKDKTHSHSDNIRGKISTMSLGLTDSEDESSQPTNEAPKKGSKSWYASASRFVTQPDDDLQAKISQNKREDQTFQLQPPRLLYPSLDNLFTSTSPSQAKGSRNETEGQSKIFTQNNTLALRAERTMKSIDIDKEAKQSTPGRDLSQMNLDRCTGKDYWNDATSEEREKNSPVLHKRNAPHANEKRRDSPEKDTGTDTKEEATREVRKSPFKYILMTFLKVFLLVAFVTSLVMNIYFLKR